ncbi:cytochrome P450 67 [Byssothecium circinans]|uniref:Cytochrome P450 67 n=1 Tax=Byssothecium circinans TaxID=147558 RepID=A0A6A5UDS5_9PLEO|nr:cytochrome P450 67 [Byssothecium circinans]
MSALNLPTLVGTSAILGIAFHISIVGLEFERYMFQFLFTTLFTYLSLVFAFLSANQTLGLALVQASLVLVSFNVSVLFSITVYRLFLHRCSVIPGPLLAKLTRFYATYLNAKGYRYHKELGELHKQHGDFLRIGPRDISILDKRAIPLIYGPNSECRKSTWYSQSSNDSSKVSINMTRDQKSYRLRRRAWDRGFSMKALTSYQPRIKAKTDMLVEKIRELNGKQIDMTKWSMLFGFDVMGEVGFGKDFGSLTSGQEHPAIKAIHEHIAVLGVFQTVPWLMNLLGSIPGAAASFAEFFGMCEKEMVEKEKTWNSRTDPQDLASWLIKAVREKDVTASPTKESLADDSRVIIIAGSDTTANTLANILFYLATNPSVQTKLQARLDAIFPSGSSSWNYEKVKTVTDIDDIINETLRLKPPVIQGGPRETPPQGIHVGDMHIPGNVNVSVPYILIQREPRWWEEAENFVPERWDERSAEMGTAEAPFLPFQLGLHSCIGKNLAFLSLRTAISLLVMEFDIELAEGESGEEFDKGFDDVFLMTLKPLRLKLTARLGE